MAAIMDDKPVVAVKSDEVDSTTPSSQSLKDPDQAYKFLEDIGVTNEELAAVDLKALRRKVDWCIVPVMFLCYTMQFIDKVSLNVRPPS
jgi:hypothetical protein